MLVPESPLTPSPPTRQVLYDIRRFHQENSIYATIAAGPWVRTKRHLTPSDGKSLMAADSVVSVERPIDMAPRTTLWPLGSLGRGCTRRARLPRV